MATRIRMPDVRVHEIATGPAPIAAVPTSIAAFIGRTRTGPVDRPLMIRSFPDFERDYGGLSADSPLSDAVQQFFANGGREAVIVRISHGTDEGAPITADDLIGPSLQAAGRGLWLLDAVDHCNLLCIPPLSRTVDVPTAVWNAAVAYCQQRRILLIVDPPAGWTSPEQAVAGVDALLTRSSAAVLCFPNLRVADSLNGGQATRCAPCGMVAGVIARTDSTRGVWKAPAGVEAVLKGATGLVLSGRRPALSDSQLGSLNQYGIIGIRAVSRSGSPLQLALWGARTLLGTDSASLEWKYVPVRRLAWHIEQSVLRGTAWTAFEANDETLWTRLRQLVDRFMYALFRAGALQGQTPRDAWFVNGSAATTTEADIARGIVHLQIGFAPLKPAEFVVLDLQLRAHPPI